MKRVILFLIVLIIAVFAAYSLLKPKNDKKLPYINPIDILETETVDPELLRVGTGHEVGSFEFVDQNGEIFNSTETKNKIYVAEYFFTTCKSICPIMNKQMMRVQKAIKKYDDVLILSFTVDPDTDSVAKMKSYAKWMQADDAQWKFLTGDKIALYELARKSYFLLKPSEVRNQGDGNSDFIHTNNFVLIDNKQRIRGYYDGTNPSEVDALIKDIELLRTNE